MRRVFKTRHFNRWMRKTELSDNALCYAVSEMEQGLIDADLGGGVVKKRVRLPGRGKAAAHERWSRQTRAIVGSLSLASRKERANVSAKELEALRAIAGDLLRLSAERA